MSKPDTNHTTLPDELRRQLARLAGKALRVQWTVGFIGYLTLVNAALILQLGADWFLDLSVGVRALFLVIDAGLVGALVWWFGLRPWLKRLNQEQAALRAERHWPRLRTSVISAVQLSRQVDGSSTLVAELLRQVSASVHGMDFREAIPTAHLKRPLFGALGLTGLIAAGLAFGMPTTGVLLRRAALSHEPLPTQTIVVPVSGDMSVAPGTTVELAARAKGIIPRSGRVEITYQGQKPLTLTLSPKPSTPDFFATSLPNLQQPLHYRIFLNDGRSEEFSVKIIHGPVLESVGFEQVYPAYTGLQPTQHTAGNLTLLAGGTLKITGKADMPLKNARLLLEPRSREFPLKVAGDGRAISGELPIPATELEGFTIVLTNQEGTESVNNTVYHVVLNPDAPPIITFVPGEPEFQTVVPATTPRLAFEVRDDFIIKEVTLCARTDAEMEKIIRIPLAVPQPGGRLNFDQLLQNPGAQLPWKEGTTISYWIEAVDNNDATGPGLGKSSERQWSIITLEAKRQELMDKLNSSATSIRDLSRVQNDLKTSVEKILPNQ